MSILVRPMSILCLCVLGATAQWRQLNATLFRGPDREVLRSWMEDLLTPARRAQIHRELRYQALRLLEKYDNPTTTLRVVVGWDAQQRRYRYATHTYGEPQYRGCFRNRKNMNSGGHVFGLLMLVKLHGLLQRYYPRDALTERYRRWLGAAVDHAFRFGLVYRSATGYWEVVGEGQPLGGHPAVSAAAIRNNPLRLYPAICWTGGKRVENWDGDSMRHDMMTIAGGAEALRDPRIPCNPTLVKLGIALLLEKYIDRRLGGGLDVPAFVKAETVWGKLRLFQVLIHLTYGYDALKGDLPLQAERARITAAWILDEMVRWGPQTFRGLTGRRYENWVSGWNPATWRQRFGDTFPGWATVNKFDRVWIWGVSLMGPALAKLYAVLPPADPRRAVLLRMLDETARMLRYRWDMPFMTYDGKRPVLDGEGQWMHNVPVVGGVFGDAALPLPLGAEAIRGFYEPRPALRGNPAMPKGTAGAGLLPEEYHYGQATWPFEALTGLDWGALFRWCYRHFPDQKALHLRFLEEWWVARPYTAPYAPIVRYPAGHPQAGAPYCVDARKKPAPCGPTTSLLVRESNTPGKEYLHGRWVSNFRGFNALHRENDFGLATLLFWAGLGRRRADYVDMALYAFVTRLRHGSGALPVERVKDALALHHDPVHRRTGNTIHVGEFTDSPFSWGRLVWHFQVLGILEGWW